MFVLPALAEPIGSAALAKCVPGCFSWVNCLSVLRPTCSVCFPRLPPTFFVLPSTSQAFATSTRRRPGKLVRGGTADLATQTGGRFNAVLAGHDLNEFHDRAAKGFQILPQL